MCISCRSFELLDFQEISTSKFNMGPRARAPPPQIRSFGGARARAWTQVKRCCSKGPVGNFLDDWLLECLSVMFIQLCYVLSLKESCKSDVRFESPS